MCGAALEMNPNAAPLSRQTNGCGTVMADLLIQKRFQCRNDSVTSPLVDQRDADMTHQPWLRLGTEERPGDVRETLGGHHVHLVDRMTDGCRFAVVEVDDGLLARHDDEV